MLCSFERMSKTFSVLLEHFFVRLTWNYFFEFSEEWLWFMIAMKFVDEPIHQTKLINNWIHTFQTFFTNNSADTKRTPLFQNIFLQRKNVKKQKRSPQGSNLCGRSPLDFKSNSLTSRTDDQLKSVERLISTSTCSHHMRTATRMCMDNELVIISLLDFFDQSYVISVRIFHELFICYLLA